MGEDEIHRLIFDTLIHDRSGACSSYWVKESNLVELIDFIEIGVPPRIIDMSCDDFDSYFPANSVSMIDMPRLPVLRQSERLASESEEDQS